jgi:TonB-dependent SusC/RagA subfamily outer membrane receptor
MNKSLILSPFLLFLSGILIAQVNLKRVKKESWQVFAYKITAADAEKYILNDSIDIDRFISNSPTAVFPSDSVNENKLPIGQYVLIAIDDNRIRASLTGVSNLLPYPINNQKRVQLLLKDKSDRFIDAAKVWVKGKEAKYRKNTRSYWVMQKYPDKALVKVYAPNDTLFMSLSAKDELDRSVVQQKWLNFKNTWLVRTIRRIPEKINFLINPGHRYSSSSAGTTGMMVFNQPKYKQTDTVKLKAYVFSKKWRQYSKPVNVFLEYYMSGKTNKIFLKTIRPSSPGSYVFQFPLSDTLKSDLSYTVSLKSKDDKRILSKSFRIEDYLLDEISSYQARSIKDSYYYDDTMHFYAAAHNSNGQSLLDGRAKLILTTSNIKTFYKDSIYIPDTLFVQEKPLETNGETRFDYDTHLLPDASLEITAIIEFKNSNNELQDKEIEVSYQPHEIEFTSVVEGDSVIAVYKENGKIVPAAGTMRYFDDQFESKPVQYPYSIKLNGLTDDYTFYLLKDKKVVDSSKTNIVDNYDVSLRRVSKGDTVGFILDNPNKISVSFTVFDGNKIVGAGKSSDEQIYWSAQSTNKHRAYTVNWQYYWKGEEKVKEQTIALLYKILNIDIKESKTVFPGQEDSIEINVKDYLQKPVAGVNLTAMSYNNQFSKDIHVPDPPYLVRYKTRPRIKRDKFEGDDGYIVKRYPLGLHPAWINKFGLDSMLYYQMLFPQKSVLDEVTPIRDFVPELSVHVIAKGERKEIYLLYVNRRLVYYNGVTNKMTDAYEAYFGYSQIGIRLLNSFVEIDSIYLQPFYKHDLFFDLDHLPEHVKIKPLSDTLSDDEKSLLEKSLWSLDNNYRTNNGYVWQQERLVKISGNYPHLVGPFNNSDSLHYFAPNHFDIQFRFEPGYQYNLSKNILRLEKKNIFPDEKQKTLLPKIESPLWVLGDTIQTSPVIEYKEPGAMRNRYLKTWGYDKSRWDREGSGKLYFSTATDTMLNYVIIFPDGRPEDKIILPGGLKKISNLKSGTYRLILVDSSWNCAEIKQVFIKENQTLCIKANKVLFGKENELVAQWEEETIDPMPKKDPPGLKPPTTPQDNMPNYQTGKSGIYGKVIDKIGRIGIPGATIFVKGTRTGTNSLANGSFEIRNIKPGKCTLVVASLGYVQKEMQVYLADEGQTYIEIPLSISDQSLQDVVVIGYGFTQKRDVTGSIISVNGEELSKVALKSDAMLEGKVAGVSISGENELESAESIIVRGISSIAESKKPLYVVDGIFYDELPKNISPDMIASANILKGEEATAIYGTRAANGVIVIITNTKSIRNRFRDYAFWKPELFTDKNGTVKFGVEYPDNVTGWQTYVLGMDKFRRMGKSFSFVKSFKPLMAQISLPQFLIEGDSVEIVGKSLNYSADEYLLKTNFQINGIPLQEHEIKLSSKGSDIEKYSLVAKTTDTLKAAYHIQTKTDFQDLEEKKIPVFPIGDLEAKGQFWMLDGDTTVGFKPAFAKGNIECYAENNTLSVLLDEIEYLKKYPYYCMEQTASKLSGLLMEKKIREQLHEKFDGEKTIQLLITKLQKNQLFEGGWSWWENGRPNLFITQYVIHALLPMRSEGMIETNIRNGLLYLQNQLPTLAGEDLLSTLSVMSGAKHLINYQAWLDKIAYDSLTIHQQWQYIKVMQEQQMDYNNKLKELMRKGTRSILGSLHWGTETFQWYNDEEITTVLAFEVLRKKINEEKTLHAMAQYFLEQRKNGYWRNTVASASIVSALLPYVLEMNKNFNEPAKIKITGDTSFVIKEYPFKLTMQNTGVNEIKISKTGGGLTYLTLYQQDWNKNPKTDSSNFRIHSYFAKNGQRINHLTSGEKIRMIVEVEALKEANYGMIEIPIPAGCTYASKPQDSWDTHREYLKNKVLLFSEKISKGTHRYEVDLETRYSGDFTINPTKVSLMYFPAFYGNNGLKSVYISAEKTND